MFNLKLGMRTIKTGIAVSLSIIICVALNSRSPVFAAMSAIMAMQTSVSESFTVGANRMLSTFVGAIVGLLFSLLLPQNPFFVGIGVIIVIYICNLKNWHKAVQLAAMVFIAIALNEESKLTYTFYRIVDTFIGIIVGMFVNYFIFTPNSERNIIDSIEVIYNDCKEIIYRLVWKQEEVQLGELKSHINRLLENYDALINDSNLNFFKEKDFYSYKNIISIVNAVETNIILLSKMEKIPYIDENNKILLKDLFHNPLDFKEDSIKEDIDVVYNYHLEQSLIFLLGIKNFLHNLPV